MRDFASRSARLRDKVLLRDLFAFCGPLDHGSYVKLREVTLKTSRLSRSRCLSSLLLTHDRQIAGCQAEDVIRKAGGAQGQAPRLQENPSRVDRRISTAGSSAASLRVYRRRQQAMSKRFKSGGHEQGARSDDLKAHRTLQYWYRRLQGQAQ
ncbi:hypothetical protein NA56DRAFT_664838 [Hyaloscypha hepaticicola]|uniref:Uncharacterized protein n=1 Tax=Hyaloscypha hepaticicola TaxID=2082293 RepID=A0A2J6PJS1_9HELO|nr:hypothetical protein NA56DRAFT_664838 [Hyaloscypha hepaticicola]